MRIFQNGIVAVIGIFLPVLYAHSQEITEVGDGISVVSSESQVSQKNREVLEIQSKGYVDRAGQQSRAQHIYNRGKIEAQGLEIGKMKKLRGDASVRIFRVSEGSPKYPTTTKLREIAPVDASGMELESNKVARHLYGNTQIGLLMWEYTWGAQLYNLGSDASYYVAGNPAEINVFKYGPKSWSIDMIVGTADGVLRMESNSTKKPKEMDKETLLEIAEELIIQIQDKQLEKLEHSLPE